MLVTAIVTPGNAAPLSSVTVPDTEPLLLCAKTASGIMETSRHTRITILVRMGWCIELLCSETMSLFDW
jgi:hypothetical protein